MDKIETYVVRCLLGSIVMLVALGTFLVERFADFANTILVIVVICGVVPHVRLKEREENDKRLLDRSFHCVRHCNKV
jgi:hypothetical protein